MAENENTDGTPSAEVYYHRNASTRIVRSEADKVDARYLGYLPKTEFERRQKALDEKAKADTAARDAQVKADEKAAKDIATAQAAAAKANASS